MADDLTKLKKSIENIKKVISKVTEVKLPASEQKKPKLP